MTKQDGILGSDLAPKLATNLMIGLLAGLAAMIATGCGGNTNSNPLEGRDLGQLVAPQNIKPREQKVLERSYSIEPEKDVTFIEGETNSFKIRTRVFFDVDSYDLKISGTADEVGAISMVRSATEPGTWIATWAAPKGFIGSDKIDRNVNYKLELVDVKSKDPQVEALFKKVYRVQEFSFKVRRTGKTPQIVKAEIPTEVTQGAVVPFAIEVIDPASYDGYAPRVDIYFQGTNKTENGYEANGATYVRNETLPKHLGGGVWRFEYLFDTKNNDVGAQLDRNGNRVEGATHLQARFLIKAYSASGGVSGEKLQTLKIKYVNPQTAQVPELTKCEAPPVKAPAVKQATKSSTSKSAPSKSVSVKAKGN